MVGRGTKREKGRVVMDWTMYTFASGNILTNRNFWMILFLQNRVYQISRYIIFNINKNDNLVVYSLSSQLSA